MTSPTHSSVVGRRSSSTAFLLSCAAIAVCGAVIGASNLVLQAVTLTVAPHALAVLLASSVFAPTVATVLLRRPGAGMLTAVLAAALTMPISPAGAGIFQLLGSVLVGALVEAPFLIARNGRGAICRAVLGSLSVGVLLCAVHWVLWGMSVMAPAASVLMATLIIAGAIAWGIVGVVAARRLRAAGVGARGGQA